MRQTNRKQNRDKKQQIKETDLSKGKRETVREIKETKERQLETATQERR